MMSTNKQRQLIGYFRKILKLDDSTYYEVMQVAYNVQSSKNLSYKQAEDLIEYFRNKAFKEGLIQAKKSPLKFENLNNREDMATGKQLRMIDAMWKTISRQKTKKAQEQALNKIIKNITGCDHINFLKRKDVSKVIEALKKM